MFIVDLIKLKLGTNTQHKNKVTHDDDLINAINAKEVAQKVKIFSL